MFYKTHRLLPTRNTANLLQNPETEAGVGTLLWRITDYNEQQVNQTTVKCSEQKD